MSNTIANWLRSRKFKSALKQSDTRVAEQLLQEIQNSGAKLSWLEKLFRDKLQSDESGYESKREAAAVRRQLTEVRQNLEAELSRLKSESEREAAARRQLNEVIQNLEAELSRLKSESEREAAARRQLNEVIQNLEAELSRLKLESEREATAARTQLNEIIQNLEAELSRQKLESEREATAARTQLNEIIQNLEAELSRQKLELEESLRQQSQNLFEPNESVLLTPNSDYINSVIQQFKILDIDERIIQCTGIDSEIFEPLENKLVEYLNNEFNNHKDKNNFSNDLEIAKEDIKSLKIGKDPDYKYKFSPHVYFIMYFLEGVYSAYLAWFLVYKSGLLKANINVLDIGAGSGAMLYGLSSFLQSVDNFSSLSQIHISYCSFEQQDLLQHHGLKFWRRYVKEQKTPAVNSYLRFYTNDVFKYDTVCEKLPKNFFDFIVISHCIFANRDDRDKSHKIYKKIFSESLKDEGYVLVVVQGLRLFPAYSYRMTEDKNHEYSLINKFVQELGLKLVWYKYLTSTGQRIPLGPKFPEYARKNLPLQEYITKLARRYEIVNHDLHYVLDDYVILAQK